MRTVSSAIFVAFAVVGFAGVFNAHSPGAKDAAVTDPSPAHLLARASAPLPSGSAITVQTELVQPAVIRDGSSEVAEGLARPLRQRGVRRKPVPTSKSRLARFVFGDGQFRPRPFPTPASGLK